MQPGPQTHNGLLYDAHDPAEGEKTRAAIDYMIDDIAKWSGGQAEPLVDELRRSWCEDMIWWGPAGIGCDLYDRALRGAALWSIPQGIPGTDI